MNPKTGQREFVIAGWRKAIWQGGIDESRGRGVMEVTRGPDGIEEGLVPGRFDSGGFSDPFYNYGYGGLTISDPSATTETNIDDPNISEIEVPIGTVQLMIEKGWKWDGKYLTSPRGEKIKVIETTRVTTARPVDGTLPIYAPLLTEIRLAISDSDEGLIPPPPYTQFILDELRGTSTQALERMKKDAVEAITYGLIVTLVAGTMAMTLAGSTVFIAAIGAAAAGAVGIMSTGFTIGAGYMLALLDQVLNERKQ